MVKPDWVLKKEQLNKDIGEPVTFIGEMGVAGVIDGKLPNGDPYDWKKKRKGRRMKRIK